MSTPPPAPKVKVLSSDKSNQSTSPTQFPRTLYPEIGAYSTHTLKCSSTHTCYYERCGNPSPDAPVALFLHGGPGGGCSARSRQFFDPSFWNVVLLDQRGCGRSTPNASDDWKAALVDNTTQSLVSDIEMLRVVLGLEKWDLVLGGSWGTTLALVYAETHPMRVRDIVLRGVFLFTPSEVDALFQNGSTSTQNPEAWQAYTNFIKETSTDYETEKTNYLGAYFKRLQSTPAIRNAAAAAFVTYELMISKTYVSSVSIEETLEDPKALIPFALFEVVYMLNGAWLARGQILDNIHLLKTARVHICHGRADYVCQPKSSHLLKRALESTGNLNVEVDFVAGAGHSDSEVGIVDGLIRATDKFRDLIKEGRK